MANFVSFMVTEERLVTDDSAGVRAILARFGVGEEGPGQFWLGGYDARDPLDLALDDVVAELGGDVPAEPALPGGTILVGALQSLIRPGTLWNYSIVGHEKLRYVVGYTVVVTPDAIVADNLAESARRLAGEARGQEAA